MKYFLDKEFIEGTQKSIFNTKPTIDLISIGIVAEDGREYYSISKDFNLKEAWNRYDCNINIITKKEGLRTYWIRDNVLNLFITNQFYIIHQQIGIIRTHIQEKKLMMEDGWNLIINH